MYIKRISIQGFKTYKSTTVIDDLSPHHNVVVGKNGSGKSNFFAAIRFVLSDAYTLMSREERQGLIHEGSGSVLSAYVEIIFDNVDRRLPLAKDEVAIRRTIGLKKDDFSLDGKSASKLDITNLLELAGFSRSNPYYIVPQGKITNLTNSKDSERLSLLKEVSGARVFETKLKESAKEMESAKFKNQRIDEALKLIEERLEDLQIESNDLKEYQTLEKNKKILEFNIFDRELDGINVETENINVEYTDILAQSSKDLENLDEKDRHLQQLKEDISDLSRNIDLSKLEKEQIETEYNYNFSKLSQKKVELELYLQSIRDTQELQSNITKNIEHYTKLISKTKKSLTVKNPKLQKLKTEEAVLAAELETLIVRQRNLYLRQSRFLRFSSIEERNTWLEEQIKTVSGEYIKKNEELLDLRRKQLVQEKEIYDLEQQISQLNDSIIGKTYNDEVTKVTEQISNLKREIVTLTDSRKQLWRDEIRLKSVHDSTINGLNMAKQSVRDTMDRNYAQGFLSVSKIAKQLGLENSVYGPVGDLFSVNDKYKTAAEVVAGNSLFHIVVEDDKTASLIIEELIRTKGGRVSFIPLNRIKVYDYTYPDSSVEECMPLIKKIKVDNQKVFPALQQIFGNYVLTVNLESGSEIARKYNFNCITLDGDRVDDKGTLSGGYRDYRNSRIDALKVQKKLNEELNEANKAIQNINVEVEAIGSKLTELNNNLQTAMKKKAKLMGSQEPIKAEISALNELKSTKLQDKLVLDLELNNVSSIVDTFNNKINQLKEELTSEMSLSSQELKELEQILSTLADLDHQLNSKSAELTELESECLKYECELKDNFEPYLEKLKQDLERLNENDQDNNTSSLENEVELSETNNNVLREKLESIETKIVKLLNELDKNNEILKKTTKQRATLINKLSKVSEVSEKSLNKKAILNNRHDEIVKRIRDLGVLPEEAYNHDKFADYGSEDLLQQLNGVNESLGKYSHINKKAIDQYNIFTKQKDELVGRRADLQNSKNSIEELITSLESQKDEAITKSFSQIAQSFEKIFTKLVPNGVGKLILLKGGNEVATQSENLENYDGVAISVSFNSTYDDQQRIEQLSGGQKSLCAIALILAIQSCDPAPFYLFDEIDANLDTQYRSAVANVITALARKAQFICTTFRPEMLQVADKFYGVTFDNKVSVVAEIDKEQALSFVEEQRQK